MTALAALALALAGLPADSTARIPVDTSGVAAIRLATTRAPDPWFGADKLKHFTLAGLSTGLAFAAARTGGLERRPALVVATLVAAGVGVGKELADVRRGRQASGRDLVWDALGVAAYGVLLARTAR